MSGAGVRTPQRVARRLVAVLVLALVATLLAAAPGSASVVPRLLAMSFSTTTVTAGVPVEVNYRAESPDPLLRLYVDYTSPLGRSFRAAAPENPSQEGTFRFTLPDGYDNGHYTLRQIFLTTGTEHHTYWINSGPSGYADLPFEPSTLELDLTGSTVDLDAPRVDFVGVTPTSVGPGRRLDLRWSVVEAVHELRQLSFYWVNTTPGQRMDTENVVISDPATLAAGATSHILPATVLDGTYELRTVTARDSVGNIATYRSDGTVSHTGGGVDPATHTLGLAAGDLHVTGSTRDGIPPVLTGLSIATSTTVTLETPVAVSYSFTDAGSGLKSAELVYTRPVPDDYNRAFSGGPATTTTGRVDPWLDTMVDHTLIQVRLTDNAGNQRTYERDGSVYSSATQAWESKHSFDFSRLDLHPVPGAVRSLSAAPASHAVTLTWLPHTAYDEHLTGYTVTVSPGGRVVTAPPPKVGTRDPVSTPVAGLVNGVRYTFTVRPVGATGGGPATTTSAQPAMSRHVWSAADVDRDGRSDLFAVGPDGVVQTYRGTGTARFRSWRSAGAVGGMTLHPNAKVGSDSSFLEVLPDGRASAAHVGRTGWTGGVTPISGRRPGRILDGLADFTGDGRGDLVVLNGAGNLYLYRGSGGAAQYASTGVLLARGWAGMQTVFASGDVTGDRRADLLAVDAAGVLWIYPGTGRGTLASRRKVGAGWGAFGGVFAVRDVTGDGRADVGALVVDGRLLVYPGRGNGSFGRPVVAATGMQKYL